MHSSWYNMFKICVQRLQIRTDNININMHAVKLQTIKLLTMFSPDKTLYSEILLPAVFKLYVHAMLSFYICAIIKINLIKVFKIYPNITFIIIYSNKMHTIIMIK